MGSLWARLTDWLDRTSSDRLESDRCRDLREHLVPWITGTASKPAELRVRLHLSEGCAACSAELEALYEAWHAVPLAHPPQPLGEDGVALLARKIAAEPQELRQEPIVYPETNAPRLAWTLVILFGAALFVAGLWGRHQVELVDQATSRAASKEALADSQRARVREVSGQYHDLRERAERREMFLEALTDPRVSSHDFPPGESGVRLRAFVGLETGMLVLATSELPEPPAGQEHRVWWFGVDTWTVLGALPGGRDRVQTLTLPEGAALPARLQVSTESSSGPPSDHPMGAAVVAGELLPGEPWADPGAGDPPPH